MATNKRKLRRNDVKRSNIDISVAENAKLEKENIRYQNKDRNKQKEYYGNSNTIKPQVRSKKAAHIHKKKMAFRKKAYFILIAALTVCIAMISFAWYFSFTTLDMKKYISVSYSGYNTHCTVTPHVNALGENSAFLGTVNCKVEMDEGRENGKIQNGDVVTIRSVYDKKVAGKWKIRVKNEEFKVDISGLEDGQEVSGEELFENVVLIYDGIAPELSVQIENKNTDEFLRNISYEIEEEKKFYDIGDIIHVKANITEEEAIQNGYAIEQGENGYEKEYTIESQERYLRDIGDLTEDNLKELNQTGAKLFGDAKEYGLRIFSEANLMPIWVNNKTTFTWTNPRLISAYFNVLKPEYFGVTEVHDNDVKLVYMATLLQADGVSCQAEVVVRFTDLLKKADGTLDLSLDSAKIIAASYKKKNIKELVNDAYNEDYESTEINLNS